MTGLSANSGQEREPAGCPCRLTRQGWRRVGQTAVIKGEAKGGYEVDDLEVRNGAREICRENGHRGQGCVRCNLVMRMAGGAVAGRGIGIAMADLDGVTVEEALEPAVMLRSVT